MPEETESDIGHFHTGGYAPGQRRVPRNPSEHERTVSRFDGTHKEVGAQENPAPSARIIEYLRPSELPEQVDHPKHYGGADNPYEVVKVAEAWGLDKDSYLFMVLKYIGRAGKKQGEPPKQDLKKAAWYLNRRIERMEDL